MVKLAEDIVPKVEEISFPVKLNAPIEQIAAKVAQLPFFETKASSSELTVVKVESRNIHDKPFLFYIIRIKSDSVYLTYSIAPETSENLRRLMVLKNAMSLFAMLGDIVEIDEAKFFAYIESTIDSVTIGLTQNYSTIFNRLEALNSEHAELKKLNSELSMSNRNLTIQASQASEELAKLKGRVSKLESYSDSSLMVMVQDWIESHNSQIDINDFAKNYNAPTSRVEEILDKMVSLGYIEIKK